MTESYVSRSLKLAKQPIVKKTVMTQSDLDSSFSSSLDSDISLSEELNIHANISIPLLTPPPSRPTTGLSEIKSHSSPSSACTNTHSGSSPSGARKRTMSPSLSDSSPEKKKKPHYEIPFKTFKNLVKDIGKDMTTNNIIFSTEALNALQEASEAMLENMFRTINCLMLVNGKQTCDMAMFRSYLICSQSRS